MKGNKRVQCHPKNYLRVLMSSTQHRPCSEAERTEKLQGHLRRVCIEWVSSSIYISYWISWFWMTEKRTVLLLRPEGLATWDNWSSECGNNHSHLVALLPMFCLLSTSDMSFSAAYLAESQPELKIIWSRQLCFVSNLKLFQSIALFLFIYFIFISFHHCRFLHLGTIKPDPKFCPKEQGHANPGHV